MLTVQIYCGTLGLLFPSPLNSPIPNKLILRKIWLHWLKKEFLIKTFPICKVASLQLYSLCFKIGLRFVKFFSSDLENKIQKFSVFLDLHDCIRLNQNLLHTLQIVNFAKSGKSGYHSSLSCSLVCFQTG